MNILPEHVYLPIECTHCSHIGMTYLKREEDYISSCDRCFSPGPTASFEEIEIILQESKRDLTISPKLQNLRIELAKIAFPVLIQQAEDFDNAGKMAFMYADKFIEWSKKDIWRPQPEELEEPQASNIDPYLHE
jgi:hypothetical protein